MILTSRHRLFELLPNWLKRTNAYSVLYTIALIADALTDTLFAAMKIRFPGVHSNESLPLLGSERRMLQGRSESPESFAARLNQWWDVAKHSGDLFTIAKQVACYFLPDHVVVQCVTNNGTRYTLGTDGSWTVDTCSWDWDGHAEYWSRFWVLISNADVGATGTDKLVSDGGYVSQSTRFVGCDAIDAAAALWSIEEMNRAPHKYCGGILVLLDAAAFWAAPPAGNWDYWVNRNPNALYWQGTI